MKHDIEQFKKDRNKALLEGDEAVKAFCVKTIRYFLRKPKP